MTSWLRQEAEQAVLRDCEETVLSFEELKQRREDAGRTEDHDAQLLEQFGLRVLAEVERQMTNEQWHVARSSDPAWNAYESALTIIRSLREGDDPSR